MSYPGGRLHKKLRGKGYVYLVHGTNFNGLKSGYFYIYALSNKENIDNVEKIILDEIKSIQTTPINSNSWVLNICNVRCACNILFDKKGFR